LRVVFMIPFIKKCANLKDWILGREAVPQPPLI